MIPSYSPTDFSESLRKIMGPSSVMLMTTSIDSTTTKTEQKERQN